MSVLLAACGGATSAEDPETSGSTIAVSVVSGSVNHVGSANLALNQPMIPKDSLLRRFVDLLNPIGTAWGASWTCTAGGLSPTFAGAGKYTLTPASCSITWANGKTATASWSGTFTETYSGTCDSKHPSIDKQTGGCVVTRSTVTLPDAPTRSVTGPGGNTFSVSHDTNGLSSLRYPYETGNTKTGGFDSAVTVSDAGIVDACASSDCNTQTVTMNGSHVIARRDGKTWWNHTLSTTTPLTVTLNSTASGTTRSISSGVVVVQHNIAQFTSTTTFSNVTYDDPSCCFPTGGSISTTYDGGPNMGETETITFSAGSCGESKFTPPNGSPVTLTMQHCM